MAKTSNGHALLRLVFWGFTLLPVVVLMFQLGPSEFARIMYDSCVVDRSIAPSSVVKTTSGYAVIDKLYVYAGIPYLVAGNGETLIAGQDIVDASCAGESNCATEKSIQIVTVEQATEIFGRFVHKVPGVSFLSTVNSLPSSAYLDSVLSGLWRTYSLLVPTPAPTSIPRKLLIPSLDSTTSAELKTNSTPSFLSVETKAKWEDWARTGEARVFERAVVAYGKGA